MAKKYSRELKVAVAAARAAGKVLMKTFNKQVHKQHMKGHMDFYLQADKDAEEIIIKTIKKSFPDHAVLAEESGHEKKSSDYTWIIDPLDGTHNFAYGIPIFGTSVALQHKNRIVVGVVFLPYIDELYYAVKGEGAFMNGKRISTKKNKGRFINVGGTHRFESPVVADNLNKIIAKYHPRLRFVGSAVFAGAYVAAGRMASYITFFINAWDIAAVGLIIEEAGGKVSDIYGNKWDPYKKHLVFSSSRKVHSDILKTLR